MYTSQWSDAYAAWYLSEYMSYFQGNLTSLGLDGQCGETIPGAINTYGLVAVDDSNFWYNSQQGLAAMGYNLPIDIVAAVTDAQPRVPQVTIVCDATSWNKLLGNHSFFMARAAYALGYPPGGGASAQGRMQPMQGPGGTITKDQAEIAAVSGGALVGGGAGLVAASGTTYATLATASAGAATLFTLGTALIVVGVVLAGYYGWQFISTRGTGGAAAGSYADDEIMHPLTR